MDMELFEVNCFKCNKTLKATLNHADKSCPDCKRVTSLTVEDGVLKARFIPVVSLCGFSMYKDDDGTIELESKYATSLERVSKEFNILGSGYFTIQNSLSGAVSSSRSCSLRDFLNDNIEYLENEDGELDLEEYQKELNNWFLCRASFDYPPVIHFC